MIWPAKKLRGILRKYSFGLLIAGLILNFAGSVILILGALPSDEVINQISGTYYDNNKFLKDSLKGSRDLARLGLVLASGGFLLELFGTIGSRREDL